MNERDFNSDFVTTVFCLFHLLVQNYFDHAQISLTVFNTFLTRGLGIRFFSLPFKMINTSKWVKWSRHIFISNGKLKFFWQYSLHKIEKAISILPQCYGWWWNNLLQTPDLAAYSWFYLCSDDFFSKNSNSSDFFGILSNCGLYLIGGFAKIFSPSVICKFSLGCVVFKKR